MMPAKKPPKNRRRAATKTVPNGLKAAAIPAAPRSKRGVAAHMLDAQHTLWKTGLSVLSHGSKLAMAPAGAGRITESFQGGLKKLEEVFDQRVLDSLARASVPSPSEMRELIDRVAELEVLVRRLARRRGKR